MNEQKYRVAGTLRNTEKILFDTFWLGVFPGLETKMLDFIVNTISDYIYTKKK